MKRVRIVSDGTKRHTEVIDVETGRPIEYVFGIRLNLDAGDRDAPIIAEIDVASEWDIQADAEIRRVRITSDGQQPIEPVTAEEIEAAYWRCLEDNQRSSKDAFVLALRELLAAHDVLMDD